ncbi:MAG TPA: 5-oxoprolinase subunit PxpA [Polyangiaceae bacterium]|nr:5-oxoprolinase subunit PxpA [Polyangiaceae bacterium]
MGARVLLNVDLGELPDEPEPLYTYAHVANIACGGHAGDDASMRRAVQLCRAAGTLVGAHPSYPDRDGFGRRALAIAPEALRASVKEQCSRLASIAGGAGAAVAFVKPHGALYHAATDQMALAEAVISGAAEALGEAVVVVGPRRGELAAAAGRARLGYAREGFADRAAMADGTLVPRGQVGALLTDPVVCAERVRALVSQRDVDTVCVHGDTPGAVSIARAVRAVLDLLAQA